VDFRMCTVADNLRRTQSLETPRSTSSVLTARCYTSSRTARVGCSLMLQSAMGATCRTLMKEQKEAGRTLVERRGQRKAGCGSGRRQTARR